MNTTETAAERAMNSAILNLEGRIATMRAERADKMNGWAGLNARMGAFARFIVEEPEGDEIFQARIISLQYALATLRVANTQATEVETSGAATDIIARDVRVAA